MCLSGLTHRRETGYRRSAGLPATCPLDAVWSNDRMLLTDRNAIIYGGGGAIGEAIARAYAREGARVFLHADAVVQDGGSLDISVNVISDNDVRGTPLAEMTEADYLSPVVI